MGVYYFRRLGFIFIQNLHRPTSTHPVLMKSRILTGSILCGGIIAAGLSYLLAHYFSSSLFAFYHDWTGWRSITGNSPNQITQGLEKVTWALVFCSAWWMLWRLDAFIAHVSLQKTRGAEENEQPIPPANEQPEKAEEPQRSENFIPEEDEEAENIKESSDKKAWSQEAKKMIFPTVEELEMAELLGLSKDDLNDFPKIKSTYRNTMAQYHPDKVSAMGTEIREVAEKKAKEINQAYEFFRRKFKNS